MSFKGVFSILSSDSHFVQQSRTILAILVKGHPRKIYIISYMPVYICHYSCVGIQKK